LIRIDNNSILASPPTKKRTWNMLNPEGIRALFSHAFKSEDVQRSKQVRKLLVYTNLLILITYFKIMNKRFLSEANFHSLYRLVLFAKFNKLFAYFSNNNDERTKFVDSNLEMARRLIDFLKPTFICVQIRANLDSQFWDLISSTNGKNFARFTKWKQKIDERK
jgi:hypothetical protein